MRIRNTQQNGLALLMSIITISIVLAVGLSLLNITLKQFTLSATARDSEMAFHAANTGLECMQYHRDVEATRAVLLNDDGGSAPVPSLSCANRDPLSSNIDHHINNGQSQYVYNYTYRYNMDDSCIETSMYLMDLRGSSQSMTHTVNEGLDEITCEPGVVCTTIFSRGFNRACNALSSMRVVQRELTIQF